MSDGDINTSQIDSDYGMQNYSQIIERSLSLFDYWQRIEILQKLSR